MRLPIGALDVCRNSHTHTPIHTHPYTHTHTHTHSDHFLRDELLDEHELFPFVEGEKTSFRSPNPTEYTKYLEHIDKELVGDTPLAFGLHPNAEIGFRTAQV